MTGKLLRLSINATSTEGSNDFIEMLEDIISDIKGGVESHEYRENENGISITMDWKITPE